MIKAIVLLPLLAVLAMSDCDQQKQDEKLRSLDTEVKQLKADVADLKQKQKEAPHHHYELRTEGFRTWRFDPSTGDLCIQLTSEADWKRKETKSQSCGCWDLTAEWVARPKDTDAQRSSAQSYYDYIVKPACEK